MSFVHLRSYSEYTVPDGAMRVEALVARASALGMEAVALTDRGTLAGAIEFYKACKRVGIRPVIGLEMGIRLSLASGVMQVATVTLLATNDDGWGGLCALSSLLRCTASQDVLDLTSLGQHAAGLICLLSSSDGAVAGALNAGQGDMAEQIARALRPTFGDASLFIDIQHNGSPESAERLARTAQLSRATAVPMVVTNGCRFADESDAAAYQVVRAIRAGEAAPDADESCNAHYVKSADEMAEIFSGHGEAIANTARIAARCEVNPVSAPIAPPVTIPARFDSADAYLAHLASEGLRARMGEVSPVYRDRLEHELRTIREMDVSAYFLFVQHYVQIANSLGFLTSDRGASSASLVNYALGITTLDPIEWGLYLERFLNPARPWMGIPDIDVDIEGEGRLRVIEALQQELGEGCVAQVGRSSRMSETAAMRSVAECLGYSQQEIRTMLYEAETGEVSAPVDARGRLLNEAAGLLAGTVEHEAVHPCGVVVSKSDLAGAVPLRRAEGAERLVTQLDMRSVEGMGMIKFDLMGSRNLSVIHATLRLVASRHGLQIDRQAIPLDDEATFELFQDGRTGGVFSFGTQEMAHQSQAFAPTTVEDIVALLALHHQRKEEDIAAYVRRRSGEESFTYLHPMLEPILESTYGLVLYQEQIQRIGRDIGGFSLADADVLRRAFRKAESSVLADYRKQFLQGAATQGIAQDLAGEIFDFALDRSPATFCRPHAVSYGRLAVQCAFLKVHYPIEFFTAYFNTNPGERWAIDGLRSEAEAAGVAIDSPDINRAQRTCTIEGDRIRLGFDTLRNCPKPLVDALLAERAQSGQFKDLGDMVGRMSRDVLSRRTLLALISGGALDALPGTMAQKFAMAESAVGHRVDGGAFPSLPQCVDSFDLLREIASIHSYAAKDLSFDIYCPKSYSHHFRFTMWLPPDSVILDVDVEQLIEQARLFAGYLESERNGDYAIGLNSRVNQYAEKHLLMLDLDSIDEAAIERLAEYGGYLLKSGRGYHFIGKTLIPNREEWEEALCALGRIPELKPHIDDSHVDMSLKRGYSTLRILESPAKPQRPMMIRMV